MFAGQFYLGKLYGFGLIKTEKLTYRGMVRNGFFDGYGKLEETNTKKVYQGNFKEGCK